MGRQLGPRRQGGRPGADRARDQARQEILFENDPLWFDPNRPVYDPRALAWVEPEDMAALAPYLSAAASVPAESVKITRYEPQRVEIEVRLDIPGIVILADVFYPGWILTLDGQPAPILRVNLLMRGAAVRAGTHHLVYTYQPQSFRIGCYITLASLFVGILLAARARQQPY